MEKATQRKLTMMRLGIQSIIALLLSLVMTVINYGFKEAFFYNLAKGFIVAFMIIPLALRLIPLVSKGVRAAIGNGPPIVLRSLVAVCVAVLIEGIISFAVTLAQHGVESAWPMLWANTFVKALPVGLIIGFTMTFIVQPRMHRLATQKN